MNIANVLCKIQGWSYGEILSRCRKMRIVSKRRVLARVIVELGYSLKKTGEMIGRGHSDTYHLINGGYFTKEENEMYEQLKKLVNECGIEPCGEQA